MQILFCCWLLTSFVTIAKCNAYFKEVSLESAINRAHAAYYNISEKEVDKLKLELKKHREKLAKERELLYKRLNLTVYQRHQKLFLEFPQFVITIKVQYFEIFEKKYDEYEQYEKKSYQNISNKFELNSECNCTKSVIPVINECKKCICPFPEYPENKECKTDCNCTFPEYPVIKECKIDCNCPENQSRNLSYKINIPDAVDNKKYNYCDLQSNSIINQKNDVIIQILSCVIIYFVYWLRK